MEKGHGQNHSAEAVVHWLYYHEDPYYALNISLVEGVCITQVRTHSIVPSVEYIANEQGG